MGTHLPAWDQPDTLTVVTLNLRMYLEPDATRKLERVARALAALKVDVALFQAVAQHVTDPRRPNAGQVIQGHLERFTEQSWHHHWRQAHVAQDEYQQGVSVLSRIPITHVRELALGGNPRCNALLAEIRPRDGSVRLCSTHISGRPEQRLPQVTKLMALLDQDSSTGTIVAGDFNATEDDEAILQMMRHGYVDVARLLGETGATFGRPLESRIDYQFKDAGDGLMPVRSARLFCGDNEQERVSDHAAVLCTYRLTS